MVNKIINTKTFKTLLKSDGLSLLQNIIILSLFVGVVLYFIKKDHIEQKQVFLQAQDQKINEQLKKVQESFRFEKTCTDHMLKAFIGKNLNYSFKNQTPLSGEVDKIFDYKGNIIAQLTDKKNLTYQFTELKFEMTIAREATNSPMEYRGHAQFHGVIETCENLTLNCPQEKRIPRTIEHQIKAVSIDTNSEGKILDVVCYSAKEDPPARDIAGGNLK